MQLKVKKSKKYINKVVPNDIHGLYPYKLYLEINGNSMYGKYIVIISNNQLNKAGKVDSIMVELSNDIKVPDKQTSVIRPNLTANGTPVYSVKEVSILDVGNVPVQVFEPANA